MSQYRASIITDKGLDFARKAENGLIKIQFTRGVVSAEDHTQDTAQTIQSLTTLNAFVQSDPINYTTTLTATDVSVPLRFRNINQTSNNYVHTIGLYASDGTNEVLYSVIINDDPDLFPAYNGSTAQSIKINYQTEVGRASQVVVNVSPLGLVNQEELSAAVQNFEASSSHAADVSSLSAEIGSVSSAIANNSGIASEFSVANSNIAVNSSNIGLIQTSVASNSSNIGLLQTSVSNNATSIATNSNAINSISNNLPSTIRKTVSNGDNLDSYTSNGIYPMNGINLAGLSANSGLPSTNSFWGDLVVVQNANETAQMIVSNVDVFFYRIVGQAWKQVASNTDVVNLQNQVNGVLARQSNLIQSMLNNPFPFWNTSFNTTTNILTINSGSFTTQQEANGCYSSNILYEYMKSLGFNNVSATPLNLSNYNGMDSLWADLTYSNTITVWFSWGGVPANDLNGLQIKFTFS